MRSRLVVLMPSADSLLPYQIDMQKWSICTNGHHSSMVKVLLFSIVFAILILPSGVLAQNLAWIDQFGSHYNDFAYALATGLHYSSAGCQPALRKSRARWVHSSDARSTRMIPFGPPGIHRVLSGPKAIESTIPSMEAPRSSGFVK